MPQAFNSLNIGALRLPTRLVRSATAERLPMELEADGQRLGALYARLAGNGVGLVISGHVAVQPAGRHSPLMPLLEHPRQLAAWHAAAAATHAAGGWLALQLNHAGGRALPGAAPVCVSPLPDRPHDPLQGAPLTAAGIHGLIAAFAHAARLARSAGLDAVQLHAAHGYLGSQFLSPLANRRTDEWGGTLANRARFLRLTVRAVRAAVGADFPIGMKLGAADDDPAGLQIEEALQAALWFQEDGLDFIEISGAFRADACRRRIRPGVNEGYYLPLVRRFRERLAIPVIAVGGFRSLPSINTALAAGDCDAVSLARPLIRQPDLPAAFRRGEVSACRSCNLCLLRNDRPTACHARRPTAGQGDQ